MTRQPRQEIKVTVAPDGDHAFFLCVWCPGGWICQPNFLSFFFIRGVPGWAAENFHFWAVARGVAREWVVASVLRYCSGKFEASSPPSSIGRAQRRLINLVVVHSSPTAGVLRGAMDLIE